MYKNILLGIFILTLVNPFHSSAQVLNEYLDSLAKIAAKDTSNPRMRVFKEIKKRDTLSYNESIPEVKYRSNTISMGLPFRTDRSVAFMIEYKPIYEREVTPWFSMYLGPVFYARKMSGQNNGAPSVVAIFTGFNTYYIEGWGQNMGIKLMLPDRYDNEFKLGLNLSLQRRDIHVFGPRAGEFEKGYQAYFDAVLDKRIKDVRAKFLIQADFEVKPFVFGIYGGVGLPIWGYFDDRINKDSGNQQKEWTYANQHNLIMMRNYDIYLGASMGFKFSDFMTAQ